MLDDAGKLPTGSERLPELQIDPSFPAPPEMMLTASVDWTCTAPADDRRWIRHGTVNLPDELLYRPDTGTHPGPWIAVHGDLDSTNDALGREMFGKIMAFLVPADDADRLASALSRLDQSIDWWSLEEPSDYHTFAGEIPWSPEFARRDDDGDSAQLYRTRLHVTNGRPIEVESLAHTYAWESYHSPLNQAGGALIPSKLFSAAFDLRGIPQRFDQVQLDGSAAAVLLGAPTGLNGRILYLREDLVRRYAGGRQLLWFVSGARRLRPHPYPEPRWLANAMRQRADQWTLVRRGEELSPAFGSRVAVRRRRST